jgi:tripartite-type tricarboxylate transporter receptor subunit TctC
VHIPYKGGGPMVTDALGGQTELAIGSVTLLAPHVKGGKLRALAVTGDKRSVAMPEVPTLAEEGFPGFSALAWWGVFAPAGTPKPIIDKLNAAVNDIVKRPDTIKLWSQQGVVPMSMSAAEFDKFLRDDIVKWAEVVKKFDKPPQ